VTTECYEAHPYLAEIAYLNFNLLAKTFVSWIYGADLPLTAMIDSRKQSRVVAFTIHSKFYTSELSTPSFLSKHMLETVGHRTKLTLNLQYTFSDQNFSSNAAQSVHK